MFDFHNVHDVIFYDKDGNKLFKFDKVESLNIDMSTNAGEEAMEFDCHITSYGFDVCKPNDITVSIDEKDMNTYAIPIAEDNKSVKAVFENVNTKNLDETIIGIFEKLDQDKLEQEKKECYDYYFGDAYWRKNNLDKPILTNSPKKVSKYKELFGGDKEWQQ